MSVQFVRKRNWIFPVADASVPARDTTIMAGLRVIAQAPEKFPSINAAKRAVRELGGFRTVRVDHT